jgi:hypothetical protein
MRMRVVAAERQVPISVDAEGDEFDRVELFGTAQEGRSVIRARNHRCQGGAKKLVASANVALRRKSAGS